MSVCRRRGCVFESSALGVHEGPQRIAKTTGSQGGTMEPLAAGMICSNEPGYYKAGEYGIRIENLVLIEERAIENADDEQKRHAARKKRRAAMTRAKVGRGLCCERRGTVRCFRIAVGTTS